jgi:hypothetical protein
MAKKRLRKPTQQTTGVEFDCNQRQPRAQHRGSDNP